MDVFFLNSRVLFYSNRHFIVLNDELHDMEKNERWDGGNRPKRRVSCRLGLRYVFLSQFIVNYIANHIYYCFYVLTSTTTTTTHQVVASPTTNDNTTTKMIPNTISIHCVIDSLPRVTAHIKWTQVHFSLTMCFLY